MKKQIAYSRFIPRIIAMMIDLAVITIVTAPFTSLIARYIFLYVFSEYFALKNIDTSNLDAIMVATTTQDFASFVNASMFLQYVSLVFLVNTIFMGVYFILLNHKFDATIGKMIMRLKIVNASDYGKPSLAQQIKRFFAYVTAPISVWTIAFGSKNLGLHDKIAGTAVIKK